MKKYFLIDYSYFIKLLIGKQYRLPDTVVKAMVAHFMTFLEGKRIMPVIWHQSLLAFVQRFVSFISLRGKLTGILVLLLRKLRSLVY